MFTGIIEEVGHVQRIQKTSSGICLTLRTQKTYRDSSLGASLSVEGACLTVIQKKGKSLSFDVSKNTLRQTTLGSLKVGDRLNLERPLKVGSRLGGHLVQGHVDGVGQITQRAQEGENVILRIKCPKGMITYLVPRASVAIDGVSLTVTDVFRNAFSLYLVPHTLKVTRLGKKNVGDPVNIEIDLLLKLLKRWRRFPTSSKTSIKKYNLL